MGHSAQVFDPGSGLAIATPEENALARQQFILPAALDDPASRQNQDLIHRLQPDQAVGDEQDGIALGSLQYGLEQLLFGE